MAGTLVSRAVLGVAAFKPTHPTRQAGSCVKATSVSSIRVPSNFQADPPNKAGRKNVYRNYAFQVEVSPRFQADPPNKAGRKHSKRLFLTRAVRKGFQADPPNKAGRKPVKPFVHARASASK